MEQLIKELAKTLNMGNEAIQSLIQNYPQLRQQLATYYITDMFGTFGACIAFGLLVLWVASFLFVEEVRSPNVVFWRRIILIMFVVSITVSLSAYSLKYILAPDVIFIQTILSNFK